MCLIMSADSYQYLGIWDDLHNSTLLSTDNYLKTTTYAYDVLCCYKKPAPSNQLHVPPASVTFAQNGDKDKNKTIPGNNGRTFT